MTAADNEHALPAIQDVEIGPVRRPGTEGNPLIDAVDTLLRQLT
jgi:hypothetical protein